MKNILIVEDNEMTLKATSKLLIKLGYKIDTAKNGLEACEYLDLWDYHIVITDLMMPLADGFEVIKRIKNDPEKDGTMIIVLTSSGDERSMIASYNLGVDEYLTKPIMPGELAIRLVKLIAERARQDEYSDQEEYRYY